MAFPRFTPIGESFRLNGYKFVDDEMYSKEEFVDLGDEAYKKLWPESLWPSKMAMSAPISIITTWIAEWDTDPGTSIDTGEKESDVKFIMPHEIEVAWAGSIAENIAAYADMRFVQEDFGTEHLDSWVMLKAWVQIEDLFGPENLFNLQVGSLGMHTIGLFNAREEQKIGFQSYLHNSWSMPDLLRVDEGLIIVQDSSIKQFEGNPFVMQPQLGLELNGFTDNWLYYFGVVNGNVDNPMYSPPEDDVFFIGGGESTNSKDYYGGFVYKFGGIGFDGAGVEDIKKSANGKFWRDNSVLCSLFAYRGRAMIKTVTWDTEESLLSSPHTLHVEYDDFWRLGAGITFNYNDFSFNAGYVAGSNDNPYGAMDTLFAGLTSDASVDSTTWFTEAHYFVYPWLIPYVRYESLELDDLPSDLILDGEQGRDILQVGCRSQIRANIALRIEGSIYTEDEGYDYGLDKNVFFILNASF